MVNNSSTRIELEPEEMHKKYNSILQGTTTQ